MKTNSRLNSKWMLAVVIFQIVSGIFSGSDAFAVGRPKPNQAAPAKSNPVPDESGAENAEEALSDGVLRITPVGSVYEIADTNRVLINNPSFQFNTAAEAAYGTKSAAVIGWHKIFRTSSGEMTETLNYVCKKLAGEEYVFQEVTSRRDLVKSGLYGMYFSLADGLTPRVKYFSKTNPESYEGYVSMYKGVTQMICVKAGE